MAKRDQRLDFVAPQFSKNIAVKLEPFWIRLFFFTSGIDSCPCDRKTYLEILHDDVFFSKIKKTIRDEFVCAPWAIEQARADVAAAFAALDDDYLRERVADINYICNCIITYLLSGSKRFAFVLQFDMVIPLDPARCFQLVVETLNL